MRCAKFQVMHYLFLHIPALIQILHRFDVKLHFNTKIDCINSNFAQTQSSPPKLQVRFKP
jgi:hypothetical protein